MGQEKGWKVAVVSAANDGAGDRSDDDGRESRQRIVPDHDLEREKGAGHWHVERGRNGGGDTTSKQRARQTVTQMQALGRPGPQGGTKVHDRPLAANRGADADREGHLPRLL